MTPDLSALTTAFVKYGGDIFRRNVNTFTASGPGVLVFKNVSAPIPLVKLSAQGGPRPYREDDDTEGNGVKFEDRTLSAFQSKWDFDVDPERYRNTYLASDSRVPFYQYIIDQISTEYLAALNDVTAWHGVRNGLGTTAIDVADGWQTYLAAAITALDLVPIVTGAVTAVNAVDQVELVAESVPQWMRDKGYQIWVSYATFDKYKKGYRTAYGFNFTSDNVDSYPLDGLKATLVPKSFMGTSGRIIATMANNFVLGTDGDRIQIAASTRRNIIEVRAMMPIGFQIQDLEALSVNDLA